MGIRSFALRSSLFALLFKIAHKKSHRERITKKSDREQFTQVSYNKRATGLFFPFLCPRANPSCRFLLSRSSLSCSLQKSDHERNAPVALYIRAAVSDSLRLLITKKNNRSKSLFPSQKTSEMLQKPMSEFPTQQICHQNNPDNKLNTGTNLKNCCRDISGAKKGFKERKIIVAETR